MLKNYLKTSFRALYRQKWFTAINIAGLTLGLTCSMLILLWIADEVQFDRIHKDGDHIYRMFFNIQYPDGSINTWTIALKTIIAEATWPGIPQTALFCAFARIVGLPGRIDIPWTSMLDCGKFESTSMVKSRVPTELPPEINTISDCARARAQVS